MIVFYDLPASDSEQQREAQRFRKKLMGRGYLSIQKSVYSKLLRNDSMIENEMAQIKSLVPEQGTVHALPVSLNTFRGLTALSGTEFNQSVFSDRILVL